MTASPAATLAAIHGIRFMEGAGRGLDRPTALATVGVMQSRIGAADSLAAALDAGLCSRGAPWAAQWREFRDLRLRRPGSGGVTAEGIGSLVLWLWMSLQEEYGNPSPGGTLAGLAPDRFELATTYLDPELARVTLRGAVQYVNQAAAAAAEGSGAAARGALEAYFEAVGRSIVSPLVNSNTRRLLAAAVKRRIPWNRLTHDNYQLGWGAAARRLFSTHTDRTPIIAQHISANKAATRYLTTRAGFPKVRYGLVESEAACQALAERIGYPVVVKPANQDRGQGVTTLLTTREEVARAYRTAAQLGPVLVEQHIHGNDHRLLVVGGRLFAAVHRVPGGVTGDGVRSVRALIDQVNADPRRGADKNGLARVEVDDEAMEMLRKQGLGLDDVPAAGRFVPLREGPTVVRGGCPVDVTDRVHPDNRGLAERAARVVGLDIAGIDFLTPDITKSWREVGGAIIEVNSAPALISHVLAQPDRDICGEILDWMLSGGSGRIPVAAVAGDVQRGQAVVGLLHGILRAAGLRAGAAASGGLWIGGALVNDQDFSGHAARDALLTDPGVEAAVIALSAAGLAVQGHPCDAYTAVALLDVSGAGEEESRELAGALQRAADAVIVNADDPSCLAAAKDVTARRRILVSARGAGAEWQAHLASGGEGVTAVREADGTAVVAVAGDRRHTLVPPGRGTAGGGDPRDALFAAALALGLGIAVDAIREGLTAGAAVAPP